MLASHCGQVLLHVQLFRHGTRHDAHRNQRWHVQGLWGRLGHRVVPGAIRHGLAGLRGSVPGWLGVLWI